MASEASAERRGAVRRTTAETDVEVSVNLDGRGRAEAVTGIGFFDHCLVALGYHAGLDLVVRASGDLQVDAHHTVEDVGLCLGRALGQALGDRSGIARFGWALLPMDDALVQVALDCSGRPYLDYRVAAPQPAVGQFDAALGREFFRALATGAGLTLHLASLAGDNSHHLLEAAFKGAGRALAQAVTRLPGRPEVPSTKGVLEA